MYYLHTNAQAFLGRDINDDLIELDIDRKFDLDT
jgi:hypothetical protein